MSTFGMGLADAPVAIGPAVDRQISASRARTPPTVLERRKAPRASIAELNDLDPDELRQRLVDASHPADTRGPVEKALDLLDLPRNSVANIAFGHPSWGGIASGIVGPAAAGAAIGSFGGPPGALLGAGVGAAVGAGLEGVAALGRVFTGGGALPEAETAPRGTFGQPKLYTSDLLHHLGIKNHIAASILGLVGDFAMDPLTYAGPAATAKLGKGIAARLSGVNELRAGLAGEKVGSATEGLIRAAEVHPEVAAQLAAEGADRPAILSKFLLGDKSASRWKAATLPGAIGAGIGALGGGPVGAAVGGAIGGGAGFLHGLELEGGAIARALQEGTFAEHELPVVRAARQWHLEHGAGSQPGIAIGQRWSDGVVHGMGPPSPAEIRAAGAPQGPIALELSAGRAAPGGVAAGTQVAHIPFTDYGLRLHLPAWWPNAKAGRSAVTSLQIARDRNGLIPAGAVTPVAQDVRNNLNQVRTDAGSLVEGEQDLSLRRAQSKVFEGEYESGFKHGFSGTVPEPEFPGQSPEARDAYLTGHAEGLAKRPPPAQPFPLPGPAGVPAPPFPPGPGSEIFDPGHNPGTLPRDGTGEATGRPGPLGDGGRPQGAPDGLDAAGNRAAPTGQPAPAAVEAPTPRSPIKGEFSRADVERRLIENHRASGQQAGVELPPGVVDATSNDLLNTSFKGEIPADLRDRIDKNPKLRRLFTANDPNGKAQTQVETMGADEYLRRVVDAMGGGKTGKAQRALDHARAMAPHDPESALLAYLHDNVPSKAKLEAVDAPHNLPDGSELTIGGNPFRVIHDSTGEPLLVEHYVDAPAEAVAEGGLVTNLRGIDSLPIDKGSLKLPENKGVFGQRVIDPLTGKQAGLGFTEPSRIADETAALQSGAEIDPHQMGLGSLSGEADGGGVREGVAGSDAAYRSQEALPLKTEARGPAFEGQTQLPYAGGPPEGSGGGASGAQLPLAEEPPLSPWRKWQADQLAHEQAYETVRADRLKRIDALTEDIGTRFQAMPAEEYAKSVAGANALLQVGDALREARATEAQAVAKLGVSRLAKQLRLTDVLIDNPEHAQAQVGEWLRTMSEHNPDGLDAMIDAYHSLADAEGKLASLYGGTIRTFADGPELALKDLAQRLLNLDDESIVSTLARPLGAALRDKGKAGAWVADRLNGFDEVARRVFNPRGGYLAAELNHQKNVAKEHGLTSQRVAAEVLNTVTGVMAKQDIPESEREKALEALHIFMYGAADPGRQVYFPWEFSEKGPVKDAAGAYTNPSPLMQRMTEMQRDGWFDEKAHPGFIQDLREQAGGIVQWLNDQGHDQQADHQLGLLMQGYVPMRAAQPALKVLREQKARGGGKGLANVAGMQEFFERPRTTWQTRFQGPDGQWRRFFEYQKPLAAMSDDDLAARYLGEPDRLKLAVQARDNVRMFDQLAAADPSFAQNFKQRPTDFVELNKLYRDDDAFRSLLGDHPGIENFFETNPALILGAHYASSARSEANAKGLRLLLDNGVQIPWETLNRAGQNGDKFIVSEQGVRMGINAKGLPTNYYGPKGDTGGRAHAVVHGDRLYRPLDERLWGQYDTNPLMQMLGRKARDLVVDHRLADVIEDKAAVLDQNMLPLLKTADRLTQLWKTQALMHPSWIARNAVQAVIFGLSGGVKPADMLDTTMMRLVRDIEDPEKVAKLSFPGVMGQTIDGPAMRDLLYGHGITKHGLTIANAGMALQEEPGLLTKFQRQVRRFTAPYFKANQLAEDHVRAAGFLSFLKQGYGAEEAAQQVRNSFLDYHDFSRVEERYFRRVMPFYSWFRGNVGNQFETVLRRPQYAAAVPKLKKAIEEAVAGEETVPEQLRPEWMRESITTQMAADPKNRWALMLDSLVPAGDLFHTLTPIFGVEGAFNFMHYFGSSINPLASTPLELATRREFYSGKTIGTNANNGDLSPGEYLTGKFFRVPSDVGWTGAAAGAAGLALGGVPGAVAGSYLGSALTGGGKVGEYTKRGVGQGIARYVGGGLVQSFDQQRLDSSLRRDFRDKTEQLEAAVHKAERDGRDTFPARLELMKVYQDMIGRGLSDQVPRAIREQLSPTR